MTKKSGKGRRIGGMLRHPIVADLVAELAAAGLIALAGRLRKRRAQARANRPDQA